MPAPHLHYPSREGEEQAAYLCGGLWGCRQCRLLHQDVPDIVDPHVALLIPTEHNALVCQDTEIGTKVGQSSMGGKQDGVWGGGSPGQVLSEK